MIEPGVHLGEGVEAQIESAVGEDLKLWPAPQQSADDTESSVGRLSSAISEVARSRKVVYTAFDGDHFMLVPEMRAYTVRMGAVPANPESVLGYKQTVEANQTKVGVLIDDLSILRGCDELWIFTDLPAESASVQHLAEGVAVELLFFQKRRPLAEVKFIPISALTQRDAIYEGELYECSYDESKNSLHPDQAKGVLSLANSGDRTDRRLKDVEFYICDLVDSKYGEWLIEHSHAGRRRVPLVPQIALSLTDCKSSQRPLTDLIVGWTALMLKLGTRVESYSRLDGRGAGFTSRHLEAAWIAKQGSSSLRHCSWSELPIPKAIQGERWPLTRHEGGVV